MIRQQLSSVEREVLQRVLGSEPRPAIIECQRARAQAERLAAEGLLGKVEVYDDEGYRLTPFGRRALETGRKFERRAIV